MTRAPGWHPLALAADIEPGTATGTRLFGRELVVWRDAAGSAHVWEDRCPHRGMRLSFGFVRGARLACLYHGWQFDGGGRCRLIPAHPALEVPASIAAERLPCVERTGIVWTHDGVPAPGDVWPGAEAAVVPVRSLAIDAPCGDVLAGLASAPFAPCDRIGPALVFADGPLRLIAAVQTVAPAATTLHLVLAGPAAAQERARISRWGEAFRAQVEARVAS